MYLLAYFIGRHSDRDTRFPGKDLRGSYKAETEHSPPLLIKDIHLTPGRAGSQLTLPYPILVLRVGEEGRISGILWGTGTIAHSYGGLSDALLPFLFLNEYMYYIIMRERAGFYGCFGSCTYTHIALA